MSAMARGRQTYGAVAAAMQRALDPYQLELHAATAEQVAPEAVVERVRQVIVADGDYSDADLAGISVAEWEAALAEEQAAALATFADEVEDGALAGVEWQGSFEAAVRRRQLLALSCCRFRK